MSHSSGRSPGMANLGSPIPVRPCLENRFYEPLILLDSLNMVWKKNQASRAPDLSSDPAESAEAAFHRFVNKLGQLCDSELGGKTVTAFVVLRVPEGIQYRFASNQQQQKNLLDTKRYIIKILQILGGDNESAQDMKLHILREVLSFNRPKVMSYLKSLKKNSRLVIDSCMRDSKGDSMLIVGELDKLQTLLQFSDNSSPGNEAFSEHCERLINFIDQLYNSKVNELIINKSKEGKMTESQDWCEFRHAAGRLLSYLHAVNILLSARKRWIELFKEFEVLEIASSLPASCPFERTIVDRKSPFERKIKIKHVSLNGIIGRMTSDHEIIQKYRDRAKELQKFGLESMIQERASIRPIVHAEVLVLESLEKDGITHPSNFFNGYKYIGCSKPTCRLCDYYFATHASGVRVRPSHRNLYPSWRLPDLYLEQDLAAVKRRENIMGKILARIRDDTFRTLDDKVPERKTHDSNTDPTGPIDSIRNQQPEDVEYIEKMLEECNFEDSEEESLFQSSTRTSYDESEFSASESDDDEGEDGGVEI